MKVEMDSEQQKLFFKEELEKGTLFLFEKYLDKLPIDWFDCVMFIVTQGLNKNFIDDATIFFDDEETQRVTSLINSDEIKVLIIANEEIEGKTFLWESVLVKEYIEGHVDPQRFFTGGENLRKFCDKKNIFYKSVLTKDERLLSGSDFMWTKKPGEDCKKPINKITME